MTISQHINSKVLNLDMEHLTERQKEWLHYINTLATLAYLNQYLREMRGNNVHA